MVRIFQAPVKVAFVVMKRVPLPAWVMVPVPETAPLKYWFTPIFRRSWPFATTAPVPRDPFVLLVPTWIVAAALIVVVPE